jgi:hypothetical protein
MENCVTGTFGSGVICTGGLYHEYLINNREGGVGGKKKVTGGVSRLGGGGGQVLLNIEI